MSAAGTELTTRIPRTWVRTDSLFGIFRLAHTQTDGGNAR